MFRFSFPDSVSKVEFVWFIQRTYLILPFLISCCSVFTNGSPFVLNESLCCDFGWMTSHPRIFAPAGIICDGMPLAIAVNASCQCKQTTFSRLSASGDPNACLDSVPYTLVSGDCVSTGCPLGQRPYQTETNSAQTCQFSNTFAGNTVQLFNTACQGIVSIFYFIFFNSHSICCVCCSFTFNLSERYYSHSVLILMTRMFRDQLQ